MWIEFVYNLVFTGKKYYYFKQVFPQLFEALPPNFLITMLAAVLKAFLIGVFQLLNC